MEETIKHWFNQAPGIVSNIVIVYLFLNAIEKRDKVLSILTGDIKEMKGIINKCKGPDHEKE